MQNNYNPYNNPYQNGYNNSYGYQNRINTYAFVNGIEGAKSYQVQPNQMVMLLDSDNPIIYKKTSNGYGQATIEAFKMIPIKEEEKPKEEYVSKSEFEALVKRIDDLTVQKDGGSNA